MGSPETLDFQKLLAPIPGDNPAGSDLRADSSAGAPYRVAKSACAKARKAARENLAGDPNAEVDWTPVLDIAKPALAEKSKDIVLATWLTEALLWKHGFAGLRDGFRLVRELTENYWDVLYPLPDEEGIRGRVSELAGLNGLDREGPLVDCINNVAITEGNSAGPFVRWQYKKAASLQAVSDPEKRQKMSEAADAVSMDMIRKAEAETSTDFSRKLADDLEACIDEFEKLCRALEVRCGKDAEGQTLAPPSSMIRAALKECLDIVHGYAGGKDDIVASEGGEAPAGGAADAPRDASAPSGGRIRNRAEAFQALLQVARFFKETEPHNPISYALERAVRWGKMPLPELLQELISEDAARMSVFKLVGIPEAQPPKESGQ